MADAVSGTGGEARRAGAPTGGDWPDIRIWRRELRKAILARRGALARERREGLREAITDRIRQDFPELAGHTIGFYWPIQSEPDLRRLVASFIEAGAAACLPVVVEKNAPLEFWTWTPDMRMVKGFWNIPQPPVRRVVTPTACLVPLVGFDGACYRLGYGGGYFDRTLAAFGAEKPLCIGVGLELGRLSTIYPQAHDIPLDAVVTEAETFRRRRAQPA
jgi:5-formyltetrahydrofolate cyclo-ligase